MSSSAAAELPAKCQECQKAEKISVRCAECKQFLCSSCDKKIHASSKRKAHVRDPVESGSSDKLEHEGSIKVKTSRGLGVKVWIARHFKLFGDCLQFFKKADEPAPLGEVHFFHVVKVEALAGKKKTGRFDVVYRTSAEEELQCLSMMAAHDEECLEWVNIINKLLRKFKNNMEAKGISSPSVGPASPSATKGKKMTKKDQQAALEAAKLLSRQATSGGTTQEKVTDTLRVKLVRVEQAGGHGTVYRCKDRLESSMVHYLLHKVGKREHPSFYKHAKQLFRNMSTLDHSNIIKQIHHGKNSDAIWAVYTPPFQSRDTLLAALSKYRRFDEGVVRFWAAEMVAAIGHLHKGDFVFRGLSPEKICLDMAGHAVANDPLICLPDPVPDQVPVCYETPESLAGGKPESRAGDWWRLGILAFELAVGVPPFRAQGSEEDPELVRAQIRDFDPKKLQFPGFLSDEFQDFVRALLAPKPGKRLGGGPGDHKEVRSHAWFSAGGVKWKELLLPPVWVEENLARSASPNHIRNFSPPPRYTNQLLTIEVVAARDLVNSNGEPAHNCYCEIRFEGVTETTSTMRGTSHPEWGQTFVFDVRTQEEFFHETECTVDVIEEESLSRVKPAAGQATGEAEEARAHNPHVGSVQLSLHQIQQVLEDPLWHTLVGETGLPCGELRLKLSWNRGKAKGKFVQYTRSASKLPFAEQFGRAEGEEEAVAAAAAAAPPADSEDDAGEDGGTGSRSGSRPSSRRKESVSEVRKSSSRKRSSSVSEARKSSSSSSGSSKKSKKPKKRETIDEESEEGDADDPDAIAAAAAEEPERKGSKRSKKTRSSSAVADDEPSTPVKRSGSRSSKASRTAKPEEEEEHKEATAADDDDDEEDELEELEIASDDEDLEEIASDDDVELEDEPPSDDDD